MNGARRDRPGAGEGEGGTVQRWGATAMRRRGERGWVGKRGSKGVREARDDAPSARP